MFKQVTVAATGTVAHAVAALDEEPAAGDVFCEVSGISELDAAAALCLMDPHGNTLDGVAVKRLLNLPLSGPVTVDPAAVLPEDHRLFVQAGWSR